LPKNAIVGTSSARRKAQLLAIRPDLQMKDIRGNVPTRVAKLADGFDAIVLAAAGLKRLELDLSDYKVVELKVQDSVPAPAQGVLAYQIRENDALLERIVSEMNAPAVSQTVCIERSILQRLGGGCQQPIGVYCNTTKKGTYQVWASRATAWNEMPKRVFVRANTPQLAINQTLTHLRNTEKKSIFISRNLNEDSYFKRSLENQEHEICAKSLLDFEAVAFEANLENYDWLFFSSKKGVHFFFQQNKELPKNIKIGAIGDSTANAIKKLGFSVDFIGQENDIQKVAKNFCKQAMNTKVLFPQATNSLQTIQQHSKAYLEEIADLIVYKNVPLSDFSVPKCDILVFTSSLNAKTYCEKYQIEKTQKIIAIGKTTAKTLQSMNYHNVHLPFSADEVSLADICY
jgi:uroporphyrinogen-III synthase